MTTNTPEGDKQQKETSDWSSVQSLLDPALFSCIPFASPTPIQLNTIQQLLGRGKDVVGEAVTGSGKTLAFLLPALQMVLSFKSKKNENALNEGSRIGPSVIVVSPTRELAQQTANVLQPLAQRLGVYWSLCIGGNTASEKESSDKKKTSQKPDTFDDFLGVDVLVGTPGRLAFLLEPQAKAIRASCKLLVLDEADRLLDDGFLRTLRTIISCTDKQLRKTCLMSATMTDAMEELVRMGMRQPVHVSIRPEQHQQRLKPDKSTKPLIANGVGVPASLHANYVVVEGVEDKLPAVLRVIRHSASPRIIVFMGTCACVDYFGSVLKAFLDESASAGKCEFLALHGRMDSRKRSAVLKRFTCQEEIAPSNDLKKLVLLCTDVAARGLDFPAAIDYVIQADAPQDPKTWIHRAGRTARNNRPGTCTTILTAPEGAFIELMGLRQIVLHPYNKSSESSENDVKSVDKCDDSEEKGLLTSAMRKMQAGDRTIFNSGTLAFVSWVRSYAEMAASLIFRVENLRLIDVYRAFGMIKLPKMPELKKMKHNINPKSPKHLKEKANMRLTAKKLTKDNDRSKNAEVNVFFEEASFRQDLPSSITIYAHEEFEGVWEAERTFVKNLPFADVTREKQRLASLVKMEDDGKLTLTAPPSSRKKQIKGRWSEKQDRLVKKHKRLARKEFQKKHQNQNEFTNNNSSKRKVQSKQENDNSQNEADWKAYKAEKKAKNHTPQASFTFD